MPRQNSPDGSSSSSEEKPSVNPEGNGHSDNSKLPFNGNVQRVHRSIAFQPHALNQYEDDAPLCKAIIIYLQNQFDRDLFGFLRLDTQKFCKDTGINRALLAQYHEAPYQNRIKKLSEEDISELKANGEYFHTVFENALFRIGRQRIEYVVNEEGRDKNQEKAVRFFDFFDEIRIQTDPNNRNKKIYLIKPSVFFAKTLKQYTLINPKKYFELTNQKHNAIGDLYVYLNYVKQTLIYKKEVCFHAHKNLLAKVLNLPEYKRDRKKNEVIDKYLKEIQKKVPELGLMVEWKATLEKPQFKDFCMISFNNLTRTEQLLYDPTGREERTIFYFDHHLNFRLMLAMSKTYPDKDITDFYFKEIFTSWVTENRDLQVKYKAYSATYQELGWEEPNPKYSEYYFREFKHLSGEFSKRSI